MNIAKLGTVSQFKKGVQLAENPMKSGFFSIHYAQQTLTEGGTVSGTVSHFTFQQLALSALLANRLGDLFGSSVIPPLPASG